SSLKNNRSSLSIELGADFISGIVYKLSKQGININTYQQNLTLRGRYKECNTDAHGSWLQRTNAFRTGAFLPPKASSIIWDNVDKYFVSAVFDKVISLAPLPPEARQDEEKKIIVKDPVFNKLSACTETSQLWRDLLSASTFMGKCREPNNPLEESANTRLNQQTGRRVCFL